MMVAPGIAARAAAMFSATPGGRLAAGFVGGFVGMTAAGAGAGLAAAVPAAPPDLPPAAVATAGLGEEPPPRATRPVMALPIKPAAAMPA